MTLGVYHGIDYDRKGIRLNTVPVKGCPAGTSGNPGDPQPQHHKEGENPSSKNWSFPTGPSPAMATFTSITMVVKKAITADSRRSTRGGGADAGQALC